MTIFSDEQKKTLKRTWDYAALDLPVPDKRERAKARVAIQKRIIAQNGPGLLPPSLTVC